MAILCDGFYFYFFKFVDRRQTRSAASQFFLGKFASGYTREPIPTRDPGIDISDFYHDTRTLCESLYYIFLNGYQSGLETYWNHSMQRAKSKGRGTQLAPKWQNAILLAKEAITAAKLGRTEWEENKIEESKKSAEKALEYIAKRYVVCCSSFHLGNFPLTALKCWGGTIEINRVCQCLHGRIGG